MPPKTKRTTKKKDTDSEEPVNETQSWADESKKEEENKVVEEQPETQTSVETSTFKSVADFEYVEVRQLEKKTVSEVSESDLLKLLIVRGSDKTNPALKMGSIKLLKQLHCESMHNGPRHFHSGSYGHRHSHFRGHGHGRGHGNGRGRGGPHRHFGNNGPPAQVTTSPTQ